MAKSKKYPSKTLKTMSVNDYQESYSGKASDDHYSSPNMIDLISTARSGIPFSRALSLASRLSLSLIDLAPILHLSSRSMHRYGGEKILDRDVSVTVLRLEQLIKEGLDTFSDEVDFSKWLRSSVPFLGGHSPLSFLDTSFGFDLVHQALGRIRHGVFA